MSEQTTGAVVLERQFERNTDLIKNRYWKFFLPVFIATLTAQLSSIIDSVIVGNILGATEMAAVNVCASIQQFTVAIASLFALGAGSLIAIAVGSGDRARANRLYTTAFVLLGVVGALLALICVIFFKPILNFLANDPTMREYVAQYLFVALITIFPSMVMLGMNILIQADGLPTIVTKVGLILQGVNICLDIVFMKYCGWGLAGAAWATFCGYIVGIAIASLVYFRSPQRTLKFVNIFKDKTHRVMKDVKDIAQSGSPTFLALVFMALTMVFMFKIVQGLVDPANPELGVWGAKVYAVAQPSQSIMSIIVSSMTDTMIPILGCLYGEKDYTGVRMIAKYVLRLTMIIAVCLALLIILFPGVLFGIFNVEPEVIAFGANPIRIYAVSLVGFAFTFMMIYYYTATRKTTPALLLNFVEGFPLVVPSAFILSRFWGIYGVFAAYVLVEIFSLLTVIIYATIQHKKSKSKSALPDIFLLNNKDNHLLYDVSLPANTSSAVKISQEVGQVLKQQNIPQSIIVGLVLEEMVVGVENRAEAAKSKNKDNEVRVDVRIYDTDNGTLVAFRDDGQMFNPMTFSRDTDELAFESIDVVKAIAKDIKYDRHLSMNQTLITI